MHRAVLTLCALTALISQASAEAHIRTKVIFSETANLTYQLDVVAGMLPHVNPADYGALWKQEFIKSDVDRGFVKEWAELEHKYDVSVSLPAPETAIERPMTSISLFERIRMAGLRASSTEDFLSQIALLVQPADQIKYAAVMHHFAGPFQKWWSREAAGRGRAFVGGMRKLMSEKPIQDRIEQFRLFYSPDLPADYEAPFSLIYRPDLAKAFTSGQQLDGIAVVEFLPKEKPDRRIDVVLHEFCHFLYRSRGLDMTVKFQKRFADLGDPTVKPAFNLLNEGLATALGNGVIGRQMRGRDEWDKYFARPLSLYNNSNIDRAGKGLLGLVDDWLSKGKTIDNADFPSAYMTVLKESFGEDLTAPSLYLNEAYLYIDSRIGQAFSGDLRRDLRIAGAYTSVNDRISKEALGGFDQMPNISAVFVVPKDQIDGLVSSGVVTA